MSSANTVNHLSKIEYGGNGIKFGRTHNKMKNIRKKLHPLQERKMSPNLGDYSAISSNDLMIATLQEGLKYAQRLINCLNMAPSAHATAKQKLWFEKPWVVERDDKKCFVFEAPSKPVRGEDGDMEVLRDDVQEQLSQSESSNGELESKQSEEELVDDRVPPLTVLESETRDIISEMLSTHKEHLQSIPVPLKIESFVEFDGHKIFKSTLIGQLNGNLFLSKDKLTRVRNSLYFNNSDVYVNAAENTNTCLVGIGSDVGVFFEQRSTVTRPSTVIAAKRRGQ